MQLKWERKQIEFDLELDEIKSTTNKEVIYQIWTNLISNAIKFSPIGSTINITLEQQDDNLLFTITNPGCISDVDQQHVFNLFYIADKSKNKDSNGIGLTLVSRIVEKLQGTITLTSTNELVTFIVKIPNT